MAGILESAVPQAKPLAQSPPRAIPREVVREIAAVLLLAALADVTIYRGAGFGGLALLLVAAPILLLMGSSRPSLGAGFWLTGAMLVLLALRMIWLGSGLAVVAGAALLLAYSLGLQGRRPYVFDVLLAGLQLTVAGGFGLDYYRRHLTRRGPSLWRWPWLSVFLPAAAVAIFGTLFVLANPDLARSVAERCQRAYSWLANWADNMGDHAPEVVFLLAAAYIAIGLVRPLLAPRARDAGPEEIALAEVIERPGPAPLFLPLRNTLLGVIGLFVVYLVFEFQTLWFREFPQGFHYSGYAHQGAAWLTVALALATLALSLIFRGRVLRDPRLGRLRLLAGIWSAQNLLLAVTVYHRMYIYIDFNGMTRMRVIGLLGITTVIAGFVLVLVKILQRRDFLWLIHRQLWALAIAVYLYAVIPVDYLVHTYNVRQILAGDIAPCVQISVHPISPEGYLVLLPLTECQDPVIREGLRALLAEQELAAERLAQERAQLGWTAWQLSDRLLLEQFVRAGHSAWRDYSAPATRQAALERFHKYAYQWY